MKGPRLFVAHGERSEPEPAAIGKADLRSAAGRRRGPQEASTTQATGGANYARLGLTDKAGNEVEKYAYTPYGQVLVDQTSGRGDFDGDGVVDSYDNTLLDNNKTGSPTEAQLLYDLDGDGDVDDADDTVHNSLVGSDYRKPGRAF